MASSAPATAPSPITDDETRTVTASPTTPQVEPPGTRRGIVDAAPPNAGTLMLCVSDIQAARKELLDAGVDASEVDVQSWGHFVYFDDPDGNHWNVQYLPYRYE